MGGAVSVSVFCLARPSRCLPHYIAASVVLVMLGHVINRVDGIQVVVYCMDMKDAVAYLQVQRARGGSLFFRVVWFRGGPTAHGTSTISSNLGCVGSGLGRAERGSGCSCFSTILGATSLAQISWN